jgi:23S rRNA pseudouridine2605 synthase
MEKKVKMSGFAGERIAKVIARAGLCSRRDAERMIGDGRVTLNGKPLTSPAVNVSETDVIAIDGKSLPQKQQSRLWRYHKPAGLVVSHRDPEGRPTVFEAVAKELPRVVSIGRLDLNTEGLLLLTNDGELARLLELPATGWVRRYRVRVHGSPDPAALAGLAGGISIEGVHYGPIEASVDKIQGSNAWLTFAIREGKNREVKKVCEHLGLQVSRLIRTSFGPFQLGDLERGAIAEVPARVLAEQLGRNTTPQAHADRRRQA